MAFPLYPFSNILGFLTNGSTSSINVYQHQPSQSLTMDHLLVFFNSNRGFRQGDSLSPFLFTMATSVFSRLILQKESDGLLKGIKVARNCPSISHFMFANDLIIFSRALPLDIEAIQDCLNQFNEWLGLSVNTAKSAISFSKNVQQPAQAKICNQTGL